MGDLEVFDFVPNLFFGFAKALLQSAEQLIFLALGERQVIVGELAVLLLQLPFDFVPVAFDLEFSHTFVS